MQSYVLLKINQHFSLNGDGFHVPPSEYSSSSSSQTEIACDAEDPLLRELIFSVAAISNRSFSRIFQSRISGWFTIEIEIAYDARRSRPPPRPVLSPSSLITRRSFKNERYSLPWTGDIRQCSTHSCLGGSIFSKKRPSRRITIASRSFPKT